MPFNLLGPINKFSSDFCVIRRAPGDYDTEGYYVDGGSETTFICTGSIQPVNGKELERLPETFRLSETIKIYTKEALLTGGAPSELADLVQVGSINYEVQTTEDWTAHGGFFKYLATKAQQ